MLVVTEEMVEYYDKQIKRKEEERKKYLAAKGIEYHPIESDS